MVGRHAVALSDRGCSAWRALDLPDPAFGADFPGARPRFAAVIFMSLPFAFAGRPVEVRYNWSDGRWPSVNLLHSLDGRDHDRPLTTKVAGPNLAALEGFDWDATPVQR